MAENRTFVIIGAGLAAANAAEKLRDSGFQGRVVMIGEEPELPYERPPLSKGYLLGDKPREEAFVHPLSWYQDHAIELRTRTRAVAIDAPAREVELDGGERLGYDRLLLAAGARPRRLDVPGADMSQVQALRTLHDCDLLKTELRPGTHLVIIGAGWIGLEVAAAARTRGAVVSVVETDELPLRRVLGDEMARVFRDLHVKHGVSFHFGAGVAESTDSGVKLADGTELPADLVLVGVGVQPNVELAQQAGLTVDKGVWVDARLRTSDPAIFACGDVAAWEHPRLGRRIRVEHWENARQSGRAAARAMLDEQVSYDWIPYFFSDQYDLGMEYSGYAEPGDYDQVVVRGEGLEFVAFWVKGGRVLAGMNVNVWDVQDDVRALIESGREVDLTRLTDPEVPLGEL